MTIHSITGRTSLVGVMGWPVEHSFSPAMHNRAFAEIGLPWAYVPLPVQPDDLPQAIKGLVALNFVGANVTVPHKQAVIRYLDEISDAARITGAVNTIHIKGGKCYGYNTDIHGFLSALQDAGCQPKGLRVMVLGAGGAARAVVYALARAEAASITVINRTADRAAFLVEDLADVFPNSEIGFAPLTRQTLDNLQNSIDLVVNATSVGMYPHTEYSPWPDNVPIPEKAFFNDLVYNPLETRFLKCARLTGAQTIDGLGMLIHQGAAAFETWAGHKPPLDIMRQVCLQGLKLDNLASD